MNDVPLSVSFFMIHLDAVVFDINQRSFCKELIGQHTHLHIIGKLYPGIFEVIVVGEELALNRGKHSFYLLMAVYTFSNNCIKI